MNYLVETLYLSFIAFFYAYVGMTFIQFRPTFSLGFHPPMNVEQLVLIGGAIVAGAAIWKGAAVLSNWMNRESTERPFHTHYTPSHRH